jgi:hypothetical protein
MFLKWIVTGKVVLVIGNKIKYYLGADRRRRWALRGYLM